MNVSGLWRAIIFLVLPNFTWNRYEPKMRVNLVAQLPAGLWGAVERLARESGVTSEQFGRQRRRKRLGRLPTLKPILKSEPPAPFAMVRHIHGAKNRTGPRRGRH